MKNFHSHFQQIVKINEELEKPALLVPSVDEIHQMEEASKAASEVTSAMMTQRLELDEKKRTIQMLQKALVCFDGLHFEFFHSHFVNLCGILLHFGRSWVHQNLLAACLYFECSPLISLSALAVHSLVKEISIFMM